MKSILAILGMTAFVACISAVASPPEKNEVFNLSAAVDIGQSANIVLHEYDIASPPELAESPGYTVFYIDRTDPGRLAKISRTPVSIEQYNTLNQNSSYIGAATNGIHGYIDIGITDGNQPRHYAGIALTDTTMGAVYDDHPTDNVVQRVDHYA